MTKVVYTGGAGDTRLDERPLAPGEVIEVPDDHAADLVATGLFVLQTSATVAAQAEEKE